MNELFTACLLAAKRIVEAEHKLWPRCEGAVAIISGGGSGSESESAFSRHGTSDNTLNYNLPAFLNELITRNANTAGSDPALGGQQSTLLSKLMGRTDTGIANQTTLDSNIAIQPTSFTGASNLASISARDPFSSQFETDTKASYEQRARDAMSMAATGPDAVRGGNARTGIAQGVMADRLAQGRGQEVRNAQLQDSGLVGMASQMFNDIEGRRRAVQLGAQGQKVGQIQGQDQNALGAAKTLDQRKLSNLGALQLASDLLGTKLGNTTDALDGKGAQTNSGWNAGITL